MFNNNTVRTIDINGEKWANVEDIEKLLLQPSKEPENNKEREDYIISKFNGYQFLTLREIGDRCKNSKLFKNRRDAIDLTEQLIDKGYLEQIGKHVFIPTKTKV